MTNVTLARYKEIDAKCTFCEELDETPVHLLYECKYTCKLWKAMGCWLDNFCFLNLELTPYIIIFNAYKEEFADLVNTIILTVKHYIYAQRCLNKKLNFVEVIKTIEKY